MVLVNLAVFFVFEQPRFLYVMYMVIMGMRCTRVCLVNGLACFQVHPVVPSHCIHRVQINFNFIRCLRLHGRIVNDNFSFDLLTNHDSADVGKNALERFTIYTEVDWHRVWAFLSELILDVHGILLFFFSWKRHLMYCWSLDISLRFEIEGVGVTIFEARRIVLLRYSYLLGGSHIWTNKFVRLSFLYLDLYFSHIKLFNCPIKIFRRWSLGEIFNCSIGFTCYD